MRSQQFLPITITALSGLVSHVVATDVLKTTGFQDCSNNTDIKVTQMDISYDKNSRVVTFNVAGSSAKEQDVIANLVVSAYGKQVYQKSFDPCDASTKVDQLCPGNFSAQGNQTIPSQFASLIPAIAFTVPDLDGQAKLELKSKDGNSELACIQSQVGNGKSVNVPAVSYVAAGVAGAALVMSAVSALATAGHPGASSSSPSFTELIHWFQGMALNGAMSVEYPDVYRQFSRNFGFSIGLISWPSMQNAIDNFRNATGGNLTHESYKYLKNTTLVFGEATTNTSSSKRWIDPAINTFLLTVRDISTNINGSGTGDSDSSSNNGGKSSEVVNNFKAYAEELSVPQANVFMTVLLLFAIIVAIIAVGILLLKVILETWALFASFPKKLTTFRKDYWWVMARTITNLILLLYGIWVLYCIFQFTHGDSWAAKVLAAVTLTAFTGILAFYTWKIWSVARKYKRIEGEESALYSDKDTWRKYRMFYENFKSGYWWLFVPSIIYMFAKGCVIAAGDGHGLVQTGGQLIIESLMLILLLWFRPYNRKSGNWINITIQVIRVLSVICILVFVEELGIAQSTKTITGVVLVAVQSGLTGLLAILIAVNAIANCIRDNPHRRRRKEAEKLNRDVDNLTPLDARDSLLMQPTGYNGGKGGPAAQVSEFNTTAGPYEPFRNATSRFPRRDSSDGLVQGGADMGAAHDRSVSQGSEWSDKGSVPPYMAGRQPRIPDLGYGGGGGPGVYGPPRGY